MVHLQYLRCSKTALEGTIPDAVGQIRGTLAGWRSWEVEG